MQINARKVTQNLDLDLFIGCYGTEDNFCEALRRKHTEAHSSDNSVLFDEAEWFVFSAHNNISP